MKKNDFIQIKGLDIKDLKDKAKAQRSEIEKLTMDKNMKKLKDIKQVSKSKKDLAQVLTVLRQKELLSQLESKVKESGAK
ncbi:50S ribosomal protein L29 [Candidatus Daviesbacteria bacterium]|nr:50S ribosomal protein L29 [Candidatus Daviesbacteria bacterium]